MEKLGLPAGLAAVARGRDTLPTNEAANALNRRPETLRKWAHTGTGPITPIRINGRLAWPANQIAALLNGEDVQ